jgi:hypothetical protein
MAESNTIIYYYYHWIYRSLEIRQPIVKTGGAHVDAATIRLYLNWFKQIFDSRTLFIPFLSSKINPVLIRLDSNDYSDAFSGCVHVGAANFNKWISKICKSLNRRCYFSIADHGGWVGGIVPILISEWYEFFDVFYFFNLIKIFFFGLCFDMPTLDIILIMFSRTFKSCECIT